MRPHAALRTRPSPQKRGRASAPQPACGTNARPVLAGLRQLLGRRCLPADLGRSARGGRQRRALRTEDRQPPPGPAAAAGPDPVGHDRDAEHKTQRDLLVERRDVEHDQRVVDQHQQQRAGRRADDASLAAVERHAADDRGGDRVELPAAADARVADADPPDHQHADQAGAGAADDVGQHQAAVDRDARQPGRLAVAADRVDLPADVGPLHQHPGQERDHDEDDDRDRHLEGVVQA